LEQVTQLGDVAAQKEPDLAVLAAVLRWFEAQVPSLSGGVLSAILAFEPRAREAGPDVLFEFQQRFGGP
jgi:hypothetical protein